MNYAPYDVTPIIDRLREQVPKLLQVGTAADYATVKSLPDFRAPSCFVLLAREKPQPNAGRSLQKAAVTFAVISAVRNYRAADLGSAAAAESSGYVGAIRAALIGWTPAIAQKDARGIQIIQGDLLSYDNATLLWADVFQTYHFINGPPS